MRGGGKRRAIVLDSNKKVETSSQQQHNVTNVEEEKEPVMLAAEASAKKWKNWWIRTITTFMMIGAFFTILASGHMWIILMVTAIQIIVYGEVVQIAQAPAKESQVRWYKTLSW